MLLEAGLTALAGYAGAMSVGHSFQILRLAEQMIDDPQGAMRAIEPRTRGSAFLAPTDMYRMLMAANWSFQGEFESAWEAFAQVNRKRFCQLLPGIPSPLHRVCYANSLIYHASLAGRHDIARSTYQEYGKQLESSRDAAVLDTVGVYYYYEGELERARLYFARVLASGVTARLSSTRISVATSGYFLARIELHEGQTEKGLARLSEAVSALPRSFLGEEPGRLAHRRERVAAPGSARLAGTQPSRMSR